MRGLKLETKAVFSLGLVVVAVAWGIYEVGKRNLWFEPKNEYVTIVDDAEGLSVGSEVTLSGLRVGTVSDLTVVRGNRIEISFTVIRSVAGKIRKGTVASVTRILPVGGKRLEIMPASSGREPVAAGGRIPSREAFDPFAFLNGKTLGTFVTKVDELTASLKRVVETVEETVGGRPGKTADLAETAALVGPALRKFMKLSDDLLTLTGELKRERKALPRFVASGASVFDEVDRELLQPGLAKDAVTSLHTAVKPVADNRVTVERLLSNLDQLSRDLARQPRFGRDILKAVRELTVTLQSLQKTWFLSDYATELRKTPSDNTAP